MIVVALALDLRAQTGGEFLRVDGTDEVVVDAEFEPANDAVFLALVGEQMMGRKRCDRAGGASKVAGRSSSARSTPTRTHRALGGLEEASLRVRHNVEFGRVARRCGRKSFRSSRQNLRHGGLSGAPAQQFLDADFAWWMRAGAVRPSASSAGQGS
jgi:hypothetical protein